MPPHPISRRSILILSFHLRLGLPIGLFPSDFSHQNPVYACPVPCTCYMSRLCDSRFYHPHTIGRGVQIIKLLIMYFSLLPCHLVPRRPEYSPQHPILKHPQPTFFPQCERPSFTPIQNMLALYLHLLTFIGYFKC